MTKQGRHVTFHKSKQHQTLPVALLSPIDQYKVNSFLAHLFSCALQVASTLQERPVEERNLLEQFESIALLVSIKVRDGHAVNATRFPHLQTHTRK